MVLAIDHQHGRAHIEWVAGLFRRADLPGFGEPGLEAGDLFVELVRGIAFKGDLDPVERRRRLHRARHQPRRLGVVEIGQHQHRRRVLVEPVGHPFQPEAHVLQADLLAHDVERQRSEAPVHLAHDAGEHGAVSHAGIEQAERRRLRMDVGQLQPGPLGDHPFLRAGVDECQVFLAVVVEPEGGPGAVLPRGRRLGGPGRARRGLDGVGHADGWLPSVLFQETAHPADGGGRHPFPFAETPDELAVIDHDPTECRLGNARLAAIGFDFADKIALGIHPRVSRSLPAIFANALRHRCQTVFPITSEGGNNGINPIILPKLLGQGGNARWDFSHKRRVGPVIQVPDLRLRSRAVSASSSAPSAVTATP